jgi:hypothetical protein
LFSLFGKRRGTYGEGDGKGELNSDEDGEGKGVPDTHWRDNTSK